MDGYAHALTLGNSYTDHNPHANSDFYAIGNLNRQCYSYGNIDGHRYADSYLHAKPNSNPYPDTECNRDSDSQPNPDGDFNRYCNNHPNPHTECQPYRQSNT